MKALNKLKKSVLFFHRYPPEFEMIPSPGFINFVSKISKKYNIIYFGTAWKKPNNKKLRKIIKVWETPFTVDITSGFDKWFKTILLYLYLPVVLLKIKTEKPNVILCRENFPFVAWFLSLSNIPTIVVIADWWPSSILGGTKMGKKIADFIEKKDVELWKNRKITVFAHNSVDVKTTISRGIPMEKIIRARSPMYGGDFFPCNADSYRKKLKLKKEDFVLAFHGIIHKNKGMGQILEWWKKLIKIHPTWKFLIIGGTFGEQWCKEKIKELNLETNVIITGWISDQKLLNLYLNIADCLLVIRRNTPDTWNIVPSALTHSLMIGKPVLATGLPAISEVLQNKKNGFLYKPDNYSSFKSSLEYIENHPKEAKKISAQGKKRVKECFDPYLAAGDYITALDKITGENRNYSHELK